MHHLGQTEFSTYLSSSVKHLLLDSREDHLTYASENKNQYLTSTLTFNWDAIRQIDFSSDFEAGNQQRYTNACQRLWPVFIECGRKVKESSNLPRHLCQWTNCGKDVELCFAEIQHGDDVAIPVKASLILSAVFENAVGNVFLLKNRNVPFLLRDLLSSEELLSFFGTMPILMAQVLLGTPLALNVRNICWHGFPSPQEIHCDIAASLVVLITSFGEIIHKAGLTALPVRPKIETNDWASFLLSLQTDFPPLKESLQDLMQFVQECSAIPNTHRMYWNSSLNLLCSGKYGECLVLLLPALEHSLRCAFCSLNDCTNRILTAEQHTLYTTMDEILDQHFTGSGGVGEENKLPLALGNNIMIMLMDMFNSFAGPRLRDKLSHGECDFSQVPAAVANHMCCIALLAVLRLSPSNRLKLSSCLKGAERTYSAKFHSISILKNQTKVLIEKLHNSSAFEEGNSSPCIISDDVLKFQSKLVAYSSKSINFWDKDILSHIEYYINDPLPTLFRSKSDLSVIISLKKVASALEKICDNIGKALEARAQSIAQHALRSRQRASYSRMLEFLPSLEIVMKCIILVVLIHLSSLPDKVFNCKFMKSVLQYTEITASLSCLEKNRWVEIGKKTADICLLAISTVDSIVIVPKKFESILSKNI